MLLKDFIIEHYGGRRGNKAAFLKDNPDILPQELNRWINAGLKIHLQTGEIYKPTSKSVHLASSLSSQTAFSKPQLTEPLSDLLQHCAQLRQQEPQTILSQLIHEELTRCEILNVNEHVESVPVQALSQEIGHGLGKLDKTCEMADVQQALNKLLVTLMDKQWIDLSLRGQVVAESERLKIPRQTYYWYGGVVADRVGKMFGALEVYLWRDWLYPNSEVLYVGSARNVVASYLICQRLCQLFKQIKTEYKKSLGQSGTPRDRESMANDYIYRFISGIFESVRMIYDESSQMALFEYAEKKYPYALN